MIFHLNYLPNKSEKVACYVEIFLIVCKQSSRYLLELFSKDILTTLPKRSHITKAANVTKD